jgi:hypothetical protein
MRDGDYGGYYVQTHRTQLPGAQMRIRAILLTLALALAGIVSLPLLMHRSIKSRIGPKHVFTLSEHPVSLTEEFAISKARETLALDRMNPDLWLVASNGCTIYSNRAVVMFFTHGPAADRFVSVELNGGQVVCQVSVAK